MNYLSWCLFAGRAPIKQTKSRTEWNYKIKGLLKLFLDEKMDKRQVKKIHESLFSQEEARSDREG